MDSTTLLLMFVYISSAWCTYHGSIEVAKMVKDKWDTIKPIRVGIKVRN